MKLLLLILFLPIIGFSQAPCVPEDGPDKEIGSSPGSYQELEDGGYCFDGTSSTSAHTSYYKLTASSTDIDFNMGYSASCNNIAFSGFELFDAGCSSIGTGLSYTGLTISSVYYFKLNKRAWGGPVCNGFDRECPYFIDVTPLPVTLLEFNCSNSMLSWSTAEEVNSWKFEIERSSDTRTWSYYDTMISSGSNSSYYIPARSEGYYRLVQYDFDGTREEFNYVYCDNPYTIEINRRIGIYDTKGAVISENTPGLQIHKYEDGTVVRIIKIKH